MRRGGLSLQALVLAAATALGQLLMAAVLAVAARVLGPSGMGLVAMGLSIAGFSAGLIDFGANNLLLREAAAERIDHSEFGRRSWSKLCAVAAGSIVPGVIVLAVAHNLGLALATVAFTVATGMPQITQLALRIQQSNYRLAFVGTLDRVAFAVCFMFLVFLAKVPAQGALAVAYVVGATLDVALCIAWSQRSLRPLVSSPTGAAWRGAHYFGLNGLAMSASSLDTTVTGMFGGVPAAGTYGAVSRWTQPIGLATSSFTTLLFPLAAQAPDGRAVWQLLKRSAWVPVAATSMAVVLGVAAGPVVRIILGTGFAGSVSVLRWLCLSAALGTINYVASIVLQARRRERHVARVVILGVAIQLASLLPLVRIFGAVGTAMASALSQVVFLFGFLAAVGPQRARDIILNQSTPLADPDSPDEAR